VNWGKKSKQPGEAFALQCQPVSVFRFGNVHFVAHGNGWFFWQKQLNRSNKRLTIGSNYGEFQWSSEVQRLLLFSEDLFCSD
jgi:hypothetical protein